MTAVGVVWIAVMTLICVIGIELSARTQMGGPVVVGFDGDR